MLLHAGIIGITAPQDLKVQNPVESEQQLLLKAGCEVSMKGFHCWLPFVPTA